MDDRQRDEAISRRIVFEHLTAEIEELKRLCAALSDGDSTGKLRGKLGRLESSLLESEATGDLTVFRQDVRAAEELVRRIQSLDPMTQLLTRLRSLSRQMTRMEAHHA